MQRFLHVLAAHLGMTLERLGREMSSYELTQWIAYFKVEPFGHVRGDIQAGVIASVIANSSPGRGKRTYRPSDFMPDFGVAEVSEEDREAKAKSMFRYYKRLFERKPNA